MNLRLALSPLLKSSAGFTVNHLWDLVGAVSVRTKILGIVLGLVLLLGLGISLQVRQVMQGALVQRLQEQSVANARDLAARATDLILINDLYGLHELLLETQRNNPDVLYAFITDKQGAVIVHTFGEGFPLPLIEANRVSAQEHHKTVLLQTEMGRVWDTAVPIFDGQVGFARVGMSEQNITATLTALTGQMALTTVIVSAVGIAAAVMLTWIVTRPILHLKQAAQAVGEGDFKQYVQPWADDEIGELAEAFNNMTRHLARAELERADREVMRTQLLGQVITAQEEERRRIARELHDETGQALTCLMVHLQTMKKQCPSPELHAQVEDMRAHISHTLNNVHNLALELRPSVLDDLGLKAALERYISDYRQRYSLEIDLVVYGVNGQRLPAAVETTLYRIVQEGLTNVARHAQARTVSVVIESRHGRVRTLIEDDGVGFDLQKPNGSRRRLGLYGMKERAELLGGSFHVESEPGRGTVVLVDVPL